MRAASIRLRARAREVADVGRRADGEEPALLHRERLRPRQIRILRVDGGVDDDLVGFDAGAARLERRRVRSGGGRRGVGWTQRRRAAEQGAETQELAAGDLPHGGLPQVLRS